MQRTDFVFGTEPYKHQHDAWLDSRDRLYYALLMEQGTGKTKVFLDTAYWLYAQGKIEAALVVAPNGVHRNWVENEVPVHTPDYIPVRAVTYKSGGTKKVQREIDSLWDHEFEGLRILAMNIEALSSEKAKKLVIKFLDSFRVIWGVDESSLIKTPGAKRTKFCVNHAKRADYRRILTGTPVTQGPLDLYSQFKFLSPNALGFTTFTEFKSHFAETETQTRYVGDKRVEYDEVVEYKNLTELQNLVDQHSFRVRKEDCLDLPPKVYERRYVELTSEQRRIYRELLEDSVAEIRAETSEKPPEGLSLEDELMWFIVGDGEEGEANEDGTYPERLLIAQQSMVRLLRLQQVIGGFVPNEDPEKSPEPIDKTNRRVSTLLDLLTDTGENVIIWARFRAELAAIEAALAETYGPDKVVAYHGGVKSDDRMDAVNAFQDPSSPVRFFVAQPQSGGYGLTLTAASMVVYYSNSFSLETRIQSEDRAHRIGQHDPVTYIDLEAVDTVDSRVIEALRAKKKVADRLIDHEELEWL